MIEHELDASAQEQLSMVSKRSPTSEYWDEDDDSNSADMYEELNRLRIASLPKLQEWVEVEKGIYFQQYLQNANNEENGRDTLVRKTKEITMVYAFKSSERGASKKIDKFINDAFAKYQLRELLKLANDSKRYMYVQAVQEVKSLGDSKDEEGGDPSTSAVLYKRYALSGEKSFKNLFFDEKPQLLQLLDNFMARSGKFSIKGFPYKLGLLLHGPPGTGKTSLIKAVAQYTKRHIVTVSLGKVKTNQELMNALFDLRFTVEGVDLPVNMTFEDVVFVMEDIDCAASVVMARENKPEASRRQRKWHGSSSASDKLNLSGLLNVLDGVIDCPRRIVIMTTNHPEKLDPALIRPGRVNKKLMLGYMNSVQVQNMVEYYFSTSFTPAQAETLSSVVTEGAVANTPAAVEALCSEHDDVDAVLKAFSGMRHKSLAPLRAE